MGCNIKYFLKKYYKTVAVSATVSGHYYHAPLRDGCATVAVTVAQWLHDGCTTVAQPLRHPCKSLYRR